MTKTTTPIYHLAEPLDWARAGDDYRPTGFEEDGFIHCSTAEQLSRTAGALYRSRNDLVLLTIDPVPLGDSLVFEDLYGEGVDHPHIYGTLPTSVVIETGPYLTHLEEALWLETRSDEGWLDHILHPDFTEVGMSGRSYTRAQILDADQRDLAIGTGLEDCRTVLIDEDVALVRYVSRADSDGSGSAERASLWVNTNEGWRLRFHQGTPLPDG